MGEATNTWNHAADSYASKSIQPIVRGRQIQSVRQPRFFRVLRYGIEQPSAGWGYTGRFRALLLEHGLQERIFAQVLGILQARGLILKKGTIMDSTIIAAPPSTKNREKKRDPDACHTKKGNTWYFGHKAHIGVDQDTWLSFRCYVSPHPHVTPHQDTQNRRRHSVSRR